MTKLELFNKEYNELKERGTQLECVILSIHMPTGETETITNPNIEEKVKYINKVYDENLVHSNCKDIHIEDYTFVEANKTNGSREENIYSDNAVVEVTKEFTFDSCHQLRDYNGACARLHGHTYKLQVTISGHLDDCGMVMDFKELKKFIDSTILVELDHYNLNDKLEFNTTAENMVVYFYEYIEKYLIGYNEKNNRDLKVVQLRLWETPTSFATYKGVHEVC